ncbi:MAG: hypothetical protein O2819_08475 [Planctomycetota bacterium]|nr:hypothetical protein [Planctomycetota bacterium]MDA1105861.1 hypothetical protein [Planctomycetota bacterium]
MASPPESDPPQSADTAKPTWRESLRHAFAMDDPDHADPSEPERALVDRLCREIVRRHMTGPAMVFLESYRPLGGVSAQALHFFQPFGSVFVDPKAWDTLAKFLERRGAVNYVLARLEEMEAEAGTANRG